MMDDCANNRCWEHWELHGNFPETRFVDELFRKPLMDEQFWELFADELFRKLALGNLAASVAVCCQFQPKSCQPSMETKSETNLETR